MPAGAGEAADVPVCWLTDGAVGGLAAEADCGVGCVGSVARGSEGNSGPEVSASMLGFVSSDSGGATSCCLDFPADFLVEADRFGGIFEGVVLSEMRSVSSTSNI